MVRGWETQFPAETDFQNHFAKWLKEKKYFVTPILAKNGPDIEASKNNKKIYFEIKLGIINISIYGGIGQCLWYYTRNFKPIFLVINNWEKSLPPYLREKKRKAIQPKDIIMQIFKKVKLPIGCIFFDKEKFEIISDPKGVFHED